MMAAWVTVVPGPRTSAETVATGMWQSVPSAPIHFDAGIVHFEAAVFQIDRSPAIFARSEGFAGRAFKKGHWWNHNSRVAIGDFAQRVLAP